MLLNNKTDFQVYGKRGSAFRSYDIRGIYPEELDAELAYKVAKAYLQISPGEKYLIGFDMRDSSEPISNAIIQAILEENKQIDSLGITTTDTLYFAVGKYNYDGGFMVTASHNAGVFNGIKMVKKGVEPVLIPELQTVFSQMHEQIHYLALPQVSPTNHLNLTEEFIDHVTIFADEVPQKKIKIVADAGNGTSGETLRRFFARYPEIELVPIFFEPHPDFPHHEANPAISNNTIELRERVLKENADLGIALDGDGDRVFFVDHEGKLIHGYYIQALLTEYFLGNGRGESVVYDLRNTRAIEELARKYNSKAVLSRAGHPYVKLQMRKEDAIFGGESTSSHFYYRDNYYADSGAITIQIVLKILNTTGQKLADLIAPFSTKYFVSGEKNFHIKPQYSYTGLVNELKKEFPQGSYSDFDGFVIDFPDWRFSLRQSQTEPFIRLNIEANSEHVLQEKIASMFSIMTKHADFTDEVSTVYGLQTLNYTKKEKLEYLLSNMSFTWNTFKGNFVDEIYQDNWARNKSPLDLLNEIDQPLWDNFYERNKINVEESIRLSATYMQNETWFEKLCKNDKTLEKLKANPIAYFSLEFGLADWLQIYSGGLGVLAGDTLKEASDSGLPMIGIGLFYAQGFFYQRFDEHGWQVEDYLSQDTDDYPIELIRDENGSTVVIEINIDDRVIKVRGWYLKVGRRNLVLLDTNFNENKDPLDQMITSHLYGGDQDTRIKQEIVLGIAGYKLLRKIGINPSILHLNEGHSAFALFAYIEDLLSTGSMTFREALEKARKKILFTNHTLKQAGNDVFPYPLVERYLGKFAEGLGVSFQEIFQLGIDPIYAEGRFGMTILGLNNAVKINAVSKIHALAAKKIWPDHELIPVTNGVHLSTWVSEEIENLLDEYISERWAEIGATVDWPKTMSIPDKLLWDAHNSAKKMLVHEIRVNSGIEMPDDALIFSWFRRLTSYKRPEIITQAPDLFAEILENSPVETRFLFGGKAHPKDTLGKELLQKIWQMSHDTRFKHKLILITDYNWRIARRMVSGSDVWINSPVRFQEACGTSGMKAAANGVLQLSTLDGWVDEVKDKGIIWEINDELTPEQYFGVVRDQIIPMYLNRNEQGIPTEWLERMKKTMRIALSHFGTNRMLKEYIESLYRPMLKDQ